MTSQKSDYEIAPCLADGPISDRAQSVVSDARELGRSRWAATLRSWCVPWLFASMERIFASGSEPVEAINQSLKTLARFLRAAADNGLGETTDNPDQATIDNRDLKEVTGEHYGRLFKEFSSLSYWDEPVRLLKTRLDRNSIDISALDQKEVLDAGCGGGRYTAAWRILGAKRAVGVDASHIGIQDGRKRARGARLSNVVFERANALELPFADKSFDIVFSNGVLHHSEDWQQGVSELVRVLKPGGLGWLYLIENPGGLFWDVIEILRVVMKDERRDHARATLQLIGIPANRIFYMLDHVMVPINVRLSPDEVEGCLTNSGAIEIRRLDRGTDFDRIEKIYQREPFAATKYGVAENRYVFSRA